MLHNIRHVLKISFGRSSHAGLPKISDQEEQLEMKTPPPPPFPLHI